MTKCKQRIRSKLWWPQMDKHIENHIKHCHACQLPSNISPRPSHLISPHPRPEPMCPTELPGERWPQLAIDVCGPFPTGEYIVVVTDYYILQVLKSDNASYFTSEEFKSTLNSWGIQLRTVTEYWPQGNGQFERFNEVIKKHVLTSQAEQKDWRATLPNLLLQYRTTPHRMTGQTPAKLLLQREMRTKIPTDERIHRQDTTRKDT
jgi:hypothetical protein